MQRRPDWSAPDVCVVGSGAGGGMAANVLAKAGARVTLLEAGADFDTLRDSQMGKWSYEMPHRGGVTPERQLGEFQAAWGGWSLDGEPYTLGPGSSFNWFRTRMLGGRTNHWGRISLRFGPDDFRARSIDGLGENWPISYDDLRPYYDALDREFGVFGSVENLPNDPDGIFQPPPAPRCYELLIKQAAAELNIPCIPSRLSVLTRPLNGRSACHYCGQCRRGCNTHSCFSTPSVLLPPALATGRLKIVTNALARDVTIDANGLADGVTYVDRLTGHEEHVAARVIVLAASACETARILLNSHSSKFPHGLANSSGAVGKHLMDSTGLRVTGFIPKLVDNLPHDEDGVDGAHLYIPWWLENRDLDFPRGYHIELSGGRTMPQAGLSSHIEELTGLDNWSEIGGYGVQLKQHCRRLYGSTVSLEARGEMLPNQDTYCELDPDLVDRWGIPVLRFHFEHGDHELRQARHAQETLRSIIVQMGGTPLGAMPGASSRHGLETGGSIIHEAGVTRMGDKPDTAVLNAFCQAHDVKNLFVADAGPFVSTSNKNPTWTILALAWRTSEHIVQELARGDL